MKLRKLASVVLVLMMALPLVASAETTYPETVKFAAIYGFTGSNATTANYNKEAIDFMVDYINNHGGIASMGGAQIEVVYGDNTSDTTVCVTVADRVFSDEDVIFALGAGSSTLLLPMLPSVEKYQVPILTNNTADSITEQGYTYVFRCNIKGAQEAGYKTDFLNWLISEKGYSADKVAVIYSDNEQGRSAGNSAKEMYESIGATVAVFETFQEGTSDMSSIVTKCKSADIELIDFTADIAESKLFLNTLNGMNYNPLVIASNGVAFPEVAEAVGDPILGVVCMMCYTPSQTNIANNERLSDILSSFKEIHGVYPNETQMNAIEQTYVGWDALERLGEQGLALTRQNMREILTQTDLQTFFYYNNITFDENGTGVDLGRVVAQWQKNEDGEYNLVTVYPEGAATYSWIDPADK